MSAIGTSLSGIRAGTARLAAGASSVAHGGSVVPVSAPQPASANSDQKLPVVYRPARTQQVQSAGNHPQAHVIDITPTYRLLPDPAARYTDVAAMVATPSIGLVDELAEQLSDRLATGTGVSVIRTVDRLQSRLFEGWA